MSLNIALYNAISGLQSNSRGLDVTAQNVSNVNTEGYSRKTVQYQSVVIAGQGAGVEIAEISRKVNEFMITQLRDAVTNLGDVEARDEYFGRMQDMFGTLASDSSIGFGLTELAVRFQGLAETPENVSLRTDLIERARLLVGQLNDMAEQMEALRVEVDRNIQDGVNVVNTQLSLVQELNLQIAEGIALGQGVGELQDKRDIALDKIAEQIDIQQFTRSNGEIVVMTNLGRSLVDRVATPMTHVPVSSINPLTTHASGGVDGIDLGGVDITSEINSGRIAGLIAMRDEILPNMHSQMRELVTQLHDEINAIHNQGSSYPGRTNITGTREFQAADPPGWSGVFRVGVTDSSGTIVEFQDIDLGLPANATVGGLVATINAMANVTASQNAAGQVVITPVGANRVSFNEMTSAVTVGNRTMGASDFLGLNDFFSSANEYNDFSSSHQANRTTALGLAGTVTFNGSFGTTGVAYAAGDSLDAITASINADATLNAAGIIATVVADGSGFRLRINDAGGQNFFMTDSSNLLSTINMKVHDVGIVSQIGIRSDIINDPSLVSRGTLNNSGGMVVGDLGLSNGDKSAVQNIANLFNAKLSYDPTNLLAASTSTFAQYATEILSLNSAQANSASDNLSSRQVLVDNLSAKTASISGVNLDEELSLMIVLENAYSASARVITTSQNMFEMLTSMLR
jgi:flagellar hook-associated protein 1 FlgK